MPVKRTHKPHTIAGVGVTRAVSAWYAPRGGLNIVAIHLPGGTWTTAHGGRFADPAGAIQYAKECVSRHARTDAERAQAERVVAAQATRIRGLESDLALATVAGVAPQGRARGLEASLSEAVSRALEAEGERDGLRAECYTLRCDIADARKALAHAYLRAVLVGGGIAIALGVVAFFAMRGAP